MHSHFPMWLYHLKYSTTLRIIQTAVELSISLKLVRIYITKRKENLLSASCFSIHKRGKLTQFSFSHKKNFALEKKIQQVDDFLFSNFNFPPPQIHTFLKNIYSLWCLNYWCTLINFLWLWSEKKEIRTWVWLSSLFISADTTKIYVKFSLIFFFWHHRQSFLFLWETETRRNLLNNRKKNSHPIFQPL